jgi:hypothetical protein
MLRFVFPTIIFTLFNMTQLALTMRGALATVFEKKHCYTCHSTEAMGVCAHCGVATYCDAQCAQAGWSDYGHAVTCASYSRLISSVLVASLVAPLGWPAHLESNEERDGFARFVLERGPIFMIKNAEKVPSLYKVELLLDSTWAMLTNDMQSKWARKAKQRGHGTAIDTFIDERKPFMIKDIEQNISYGNDTLLKQIWRNLLPSERQYFMRDVQKREVLVPESDDERAHKRRRLAIDTVINYMTGHENGLPTEMIMAVINHLSPEDIMATASVDKHLNEIVWELLYMIDIVPMINSTPESKALFKTLVAIETGSNITSTSESEAPPQILSVKNTNFKRLYFAFGLTLAKAMATAIIGDMTDENAGDDSAPSTRFFVISNGFHGEHFFEGRTVPKFIRSLSDIKDFDLRRAYEIKWNDSIMSPDLIGAKLVEARCESMVKKLKETHGWEHRRNIALLLSKQLDDTLFKQYYGHPYWNNGIRLMRYNNNRAKYLDFRRYMVVMDALHARRFGWDETDVNRTTAALQKALETFCFDLFISRCPDMTLTIHYAEDVHNNDDLKNTWRDDDSMVSKRVERSTMISLTTGASEVEAEYINHTEIRRLQREFHLSHV